MADNNCVLLERRGQAYWITINRPDKRNAINKDVIAGIRDGWRQAQADREVRVIVLTAAGATRSVIWVGHREIDSRRHPRPGSLQGSLEVSRPGKAPCRYLQSEC